MSTLYDEHACTGVDVTMNQRSTDDAYEPIYGTIPGTPAWGCAQGPMIYDMLVVYFL
jgi:hypothetical protein